MGRQRNKNTHRRRKNSRKRRQICREISCDDQNSKSHSAIDNAPLPLGAYIDLNNFTTLLSFLPVMKIYGKNGIKFVYNLFDDIGKCIAYIRRKHITHLYT